ncbi:ABC transporter permease [Paenibacillus sp. GCM10028914]|uniref:ABC transporter permease n=1 Tax=Paenibacillus sp. GCM10028914 TaxID=3273416 RepID=UPI003621916A
MVDNLKRLYEYKSLLINFTNKEIKLKYKNSILGFLWSFLNPLVMLGIYTFVFKYVIKIQIEDFELFLFSGLISWTFLNSTIVMSSNSLINQGNLIKKVYFPREVIPLSVVFSNFINYMVMIVIIFLATLLIQGEVSSHIYLLPLIIGITILFTTGLSLIVSIMTVKYRDVSYLVEVLLLFLFYMTPIVYSQELVPTEYLYLISLNPFNWMVSLHRAVFLPGINFEWTDFNALFVVSLLVFWIGYSLFKKKEMSIVEKL